jgi:drug/metabolite transporter (DMT)-like permease
MLAGRFDAVRGALYGIASAVLFGLSTPLSKRLLPGINPILFSGLLYLGAGLGLFVVRLALPSREAAVQRGDWPKLAGIIILGGVIGPVLLMVGLRHATALSASLLLNLEAPLTMLIAVLFFHDHLGRVGILAVAAILAGSAFVGLEAGDLGFGWMGVAAVTGACASWALDNNLAERLSLRDPVAVIRTKGLGAGLVTTSIGLLWSPRLPPSTVWVLGLGFVSFGLSLVLHIKAQRELGAARQAAIFAVAPFIGALASTIVLHEHLGTADLLGGSLMAVGMFALLGSRHRHAHRHEPVEHDHLHVHDEHHQHLHDEAVVEPHSHLHRHVALVHDHPHVPDLHHHHRH